MLTSCFSLRLADIAHTYKETNFKKYKVHPNNFRRSFLSLDLSSLG
jgi:hypothetical protein